MKIRDEKDTRYLLILVLIFVLLAAGIIVAGYRYYANYAANYRVLVENQLSSIAELKTGDLARWRQERTGDAGICYKNPAFSALVERYFENAGDAEAEGQLRTWLGRLQDALRYERVMLLDSGYAKKMVAPEGPERNISFVSAGTSAILQSGQVAFEDLYFNEVNEKIYLKVMVPILAPTDGSRVIGFLALRIDPADYLYTMLQRWPTPSATAETLIVRRDGNDVLYLNELKFQQDTALKLRIPLDKIELPSVRGVFGYEGITEGRDYRGAEVIAAVRSVPDSPWILVARMDTAEVYAPLTQMRWVIMVLIGALLTGAGAGVGLVWRRRSQLFYKRRTEAAEALRESEEKFRIGAASASDLIWDWDILRGKLEWFGDIDQMLGYAPGEFPRTLEAWEKMIHAPDHDRVMSARERHLDARLPYNEEYRTVRKDGSLRYWVDRGTAMWDETGKAFRMIGACSDITERKQAEEALKESEANYRLLSDHMTDTVWLMDMQFKTTYQSPSVQRTRGFTPQEIREIPPEKNMTPESFKLGTEVFLEEMAKVEADPDYNFVRTLDLEFYRKDGTTFWSENTFTLIRDENGKPLSILGEGRDITERKMAQDLQRISEERYRSVVENANEIIIVAQDGLIKFANRKMEELSGYTRKELLSVALIEFVHPDDRQFLVESDFHKLNGDKFVAAHPVRLIDKHGQIIWMEISAVVINWECRRATLNFVSDITERRKSEEDLRESEEKYRNLVELLHEGIWVIDEDTRTTYVNTAMAGMLGYMVEEMLGKELFSFMDERGRELAAQNVERRREGISETHDFEFLRKDGTRIYASLSTTPVTGKDGKYKGALAGVQDITDRRRLEEERQRAEKLESVGVLAGGIAHDFNNILTSIMGYISLAGTEAAPGSELQHSLEQAEKASLRAKGLTEQLLTFSRGGAPVKDLASLTELLKDTAGFALRGSNVKCRFSIPDDLWHAEIDAGQVSQVIHNLVVNAQQSMPAGGTIEITAENMALSGMQSLGKGLPVNAGNYVRIAVTDHGIGIPAEQLDRIFDPFFTTKQKGSGLGLATSFSIARQHGGHLSVESEVGSGSTFYLYLPASTKTSAPQRAKKERVKPVGKARILVMDDEQGVREVAGRMLTHIGYEDIEFAGDGAAAIKLYKAAMKSGNPFSAVILDLTIAGGMGGEETIKKLLKIDPGVKAIVSSGYADDPVIAEYSDYGFSGMVAKPYTIEQLRKALRDVIG